MFRSLLLRAIKPKLKDMNTTSKLLAHSWLHALGVLLYTAFAAIVISSSNALFGNKPSIWGGVAFLMLFVLSAAIVGLLIFAKPVTLFINGEKKEAVTFLIATLAWLAILTTLVITSRLLTS